MESAKPTAIADGTIKRKTAFDNVGADWVVTQQKTPTTMISRSDPLKPVTALVQMSSPHARAKAVHMAIDLLDWTLLIPRTVMKKTGTPKMTVRPGRPKRPE